MSLRANIFIFLVSLLFWGCASTNGNKAEVILRQNSLITIPGKKPFVRKKDTPFRIEEYPALIEAPGHMGVMLVNDSGQNSHQLDVKLRTVQKWGGEAFNKKVNSNLNELVSEINEVQFLIANEHMNEALDKLEKVQLKNPAITSLGFLKASCLLLLGENEKAKVTLKSALADFPDNAVGKKLLEEINSKSNVSETAPVKRTVSGKKSGSKK